MIRSYDLACALKILICLLERYDEHSFSTFCDEEVEMLKELYRAIPKPDTKVIGNEYIGALSTFYHAYTVVAQKANLDDEDTETIQYFLNKLSLKIEGLMYYQRRYGYTAKSNMVS